MAPLSCTDTFYPRYLQREELSSRIWVRPIILNSRVFLPFAPPHKQGSAGAMSWSEKGSKKQKRCLHPLRIKFRPSHSGESSYKQTRRERERWEGTRTGFKQQEKSLLRPQGQRGHEFCATPSPRVRAKSAMAAMDLRNPNLDDFVGLSWSCWVDRVNVLRLDGESHSLSQTLVRHQVSASPSCDLLFVGYMKRQERRPKQKTRWVLVQHLCLGC